MATKDLITLAISSLAFIVAVLSFINTLRQRRVDNQRTLRIALTDVIAELVGTDWERSQLDRENPGTSDDKIVDMRRILNSKRSYLVRHGDFLAEQMPDLITDADLNSLARAFADIGDYDKAHAYWRRCVARSSTSLIRSMNLRGYGRFLFRLGEFGGGRKAYRESLEIEVPDNDETRRIRADTYAMWMKAEQDYGFTEESQRLRDSAISFARRIGTTKSREDMIAYVESVFRAAPASNQAIQRTAPRSDE